MSSSRPNSGAPRRAAFVPGLWLLVAVACTLGAGCQTQPAKLATTNLNATGVQLYLSLPLQDTPDAFLGGVESELRERLVLNGYDSTGVARGLPEDELLAHLSELNERIPGTAALHVVFVAAPIGFGKLYAKIKATVYDPSGRILLVGDLEPPQGSIPEVIFPLSHPEDAGHTWCRQVWDQTLSLVLSRRG